MWNADESLLNSSNIIPYFPLKVRGKLDKNTRKKYNTSLIVDVHARDIVDSFVRDRWVSYASVQLTVIEISTKALQIIAFNKENNT